MLNYLQLAASASSQRTGNDKISAPHGDHGRAPSGKAGLTTAGEDPAKIAATLAAKRAQIKTLPDQIRFLREQITHEEAKGTRRYRYSDGRHYRTGGVSRAAILCEELEDLTKQKDLLSQQIAILKSMLSRFSR